MIAKIKIQPTRVWTATGIVTADSFEARRLTYNGPDGAVDCYLYSGDVLVGSQNVPITEAQCNAWTDDNIFATVIAENAGLTPIPEPA